MCCAACIASLGAHTTASGQVSWCGFAQAIVEAMRETETPEVQRILPISSSEFPSPAQRPLNSVLSNDKFGERFGFKLEDCEKGLKESVLEILRRESLTTTH